MEWISIYGLAIIAIIMVPNIIYAVKCKDGFINKWNNKIVEAVEQIGRFSCFGFMIISVCSITVRRTVIASKPENQALSCLKIALRVILRRTHYLMSSSFRPKGRTKVQGFL